MLIRLKGPTKHSGATFQPRRSSLFKKVERLKVIKFANSRVLNILKFLFYFLRLNLIYINNITSGRQDVQGYTGI